MISITEAQKNIERWYGLARDDERVQGRRWYMIAHLFCEQLADTSGYSLDQVAGVLAALSPQCPWSENMRACEELVNTGDILQTICYPANIDKAKAILKGAHITELFKANKVLAFYHNIRYPYQSKRVTVDTHTARVAFDTLQLTSKHSNFVFNRHGNMVIQQAYKRVARENATLPSIVQATTWLAMRRVLRKHVDVNQLDLYIK